MGLNGVFVLDGGVSFILVPLVVGELLVEVFHELVPVGFGENRGGGNALVFLVALGDAGVGEVLVGRELGPVDEECFRLGVKLF